MDNRAIGVFDSGLGGLTAVRRLHEILPEENIIYFGDTGRVPYGTRGPATILKYTRQDVAFLRQFDIKAIIVACNTATAVALDTVSAEQTLPIIGVVVPACEKAARVTKNGKIGVVGTAATVKSGAYERELHKRNEDISVFMQPCPLFVPLVENGRVQAGDVVIETVVEEYLAPIKAQGVDTLILGCTHYPLLSDVIAKFMGPAVTLVDSGAEAANQALTQVARAARTRGTTEYYVSDDPDNFSHLAGLFLQEKVQEQAKLVDISVY